MPFNLEKVLDSVIFLVIALSKIIKPAIIAKATKIIIKGSSGFLVGKNKRFEGISYFI